MVSRYSVFSLSLLLPIFINPVGAQHAPAPSNMFTVSGFVVRYADSPQQIAVLKTLPPNKLVVRQWGGKNYYVYADHECRCAFVGTPQAYQTYQQGGPSGMQFGGAGNTALPRYDTDQLRGEMSRDNATSQPDATSGMDFIFRGVN